MGIGTELIKKLVDFATTEKMTSIKLDVIYRNPAKHLYQRMGFSEVKGSRIKNPKFIKHLIGVEGLVVMKKLLPET